jgi:hypothetical protein
MFRRRRLLLRSRRGRELSKQATVHPPCRVITGRKQTRSMGISCNLSPRNQWRLETGSERAERARSMERLRPGRVNRRCQTGSIRHSVVARLQGAGAEGCVCAESRGGRAGRRACVGYYSGSGGSRAYVAGAGVATPVLP